MSLTRTPSTRTTSGTTSTSAPPAAARLSSATAPLITAAWPTTAIARDGAWASATGSSARETPSSTAASATATTAGRTARAIAATASASPRATTPIIGAEGTTITAHAMPIDHAAATTAAGMREAASINSAGIVDSQRQVAPRDHERRFAHPKHVDQLADVLKAAEVGAVVDDLLRKSRGESRHHLELVDGRGVEVGAGDDHRPRSALREGHLDLFPVLQTAGHVRQSRGVRVRGQPTCCGDGVVNAIATV